MTPYEDLLDFVERQSELIGRSAWVEAIALGGERHAVLGALPKNPPAEAAELLENVRGQLERNAAAIAAGLAQTRGAIDRIGRSRKALGSYASPPRSQLEVRG